MGEHSELLNTMFEYLKTPLEERVPNQVSYVVCPSGDIRPDVIMQAFQDKNLFEQITAKYPDRVEVVNSEEHFLTLAMIRHGAEAHMLLTQLFAQPPFEGARLLRLPDSLIACGRGFNLVMRDFDPSDLVSD